MNHLLRLSSVQLARFGPSVARYFTAATALKKV